MLAFLLKFDGANLVVEICGDINCKNSKIGLNEGECLDVEAREGKKGFQSHRC